MYAFLPAKVMGWQGYLLVVGGALLLAIWTMILKKLVDKKSGTEGVSADAVSAVTFFGSGLILLVVSLIFDPPKIFSWFSPTGLFWPLAATSLLNIFIMYSIGRSLKGADASLIAPLGAFGSLISILPSWLILNEVPTTYGYIGLTLMFIGLYATAFIEGKKVQLETIPLWAKTMDSRPRLIAPLIMLFRNKYVAISLVGTSLGAVSVNFDKLAAMRSSSTFAASMVMLFISLVGLYKTNKSGELSQICKKHILSLVLSAVSLAFVLVLFWLAFHYGLAIYVSALKRTNVIFVMLISYFFLGESVGVKKRLPAVLMIVVASVLLGF